MSARFWNRALVAMLALLLLVVLAGEFYDHARVDAILQGRLNLAQAQIAANGLTVAQAEYQLDRVLDGDRADITALQHEVATLRAQDAQLEQQITALQAALGVQAQSPSALGSGPPGATPATRPSSPSHPTSTPPVTQQPSPTCLLGIICTGAVQSATHAQNDHQCCKEKKP